MRRPVLAQKHRLVRQGEVDEFLVIRVTANQMGFGLHVHLLHLGIKLGQHLGHADLRLTQAQHDVGVVQHPLQLVAHGRGGKEQAASRDRLQEIDAELAKKEEELILLRESLGDKNKQVRILLAEVARLRSAAANLRRSA